MSKRSLLRRNVTRALGSQAAGGPLATSVLLRVAAAAVQAALPIVALHRLGVETGAWVAGAVVSGRALSGFVTLGLHEALVRAAAAGRQANLRPAVILAGAVALGAAAHQTYLTLTVATVLTLAAIRLVAAAPKGSGRPLLAINVEFIVPGAAAVAALLVAPVALGPVAVLLSLVASAIFAVAVVRPEPGIVRSNRIALGGWKDTIARGVAAAGLGVLPNLPVLAIGARGSSSDAALAVLLLATRIGAVPTIAFSAVAITGARDLAGHDRRAASRVIARSRIPALVAAVPLLIGCLVLWVEADGVGQVVASWLGLAPTDARNLWAATTVLLMSQVVSAAVGVVQEANLLGADPRPEAWGVFVLLAAWVPVGAFLPIDVDAFAFAASATLVLKQLHSTVLWRRSQPHEVPE